MATKNKSSLGGKILRWGAGTAGTGVGLDFIANLLQSLPMKDGGRVRGIGKAKRGFGRAMRKK
jgi:hypothetical protein|tara:strand:+ start:176 stop:364 length:189 start_codon:yes stop_codon:yes gene_type:complete